MRQMVEISRHISAAPAVSPYLVEERARTAKRTQHRRLYMGGTMNYFEIAVPKMPCHRNSTSSSNDNSNEESIPPFGRKTLLLPCNVHSEKKKGHLSQISDNIYNQQILKIAWIESVFTGLCCNTLVAPPFGFIGASHCELDFYRRF